MATYTREQIIRQVLMELGILDSNEAPEAEDAHDVGIRLQQVFEELNDEGLIPFQLEGEIPASYASPLSFIVARELVSTFGVESRASLLEQRADTAMTRLWKLREKTQSDQDARAVYY
ncbi:hypothetical protein [Xanthomonas arboricola]|uniref:Uncharacterized protein n=1 Tax=Xanthomonas arboricola TaxID=56448 RepID=A0AAU9I6R3_9XANT|nr:hypothetical protein [Xanthomonas arboricola]CAE6836791.1 hypothetical protein XA1314C_37220 [Xanthomonas arboricola]CAE6836809.1 hypothetical protein XA1314C_37220 [Xanthomonas arboricola]